MWWDRHIPAGQTFDEVIQEKVAAARCVVVLWSKNSIESKWVKIEAHAGSNRGILIPAALITNMDLLPLAFRFDQTASLVGWKEKSRTEDTNRLSMRSRLWRDSHGASEPAMGRSASLMFSRRRDVKPRPMPRRDPRPR